MANKSCVFMDRRKSTIKTARFVNISLPATTPVITA